MTNFTKGPWVAQKDPNGSDRDWLVGTEDLGIDAIASCYKQDAALIAASPVMYAALEPFADYPDDFFDVDDDKPVTITVLGRNLKAARAARAKAEGK